MKKLLLMVLILTGFAITSGAQTVRLPARQNIKMERKIERREARRQIRMERRRHHRRHRRVVAEFNIISLRKTVDC